MVSPGRPDGGGDGGGGRPLPHRCIFRGCLVAEDGVDEAVEDAGKLVETVRTPELARLLHELAHRRVAAVDDLVLVRMKYSDHNTVILRAQHLHARACSGGRARRLEDDARDHAVVDLRRDLEKRPDEVADAVRVGPAALRVGPCASSRRARRRGTSAIPSPLFKEEVLARLGVADAQEEERAAGDHCWKCWSTNTKAPATAGRWSERRGEGKRPGGVRGAGTSGPR
mmetsp:Transcript_3014/g.10708  ORF Transcript_3014/g.10708 Transcript_3014/m.10708 type:complete len:227 (-) Transcript_3014:2-682(-)